MHTGSTDNYALTQFASSDKPAWLTDYNEDMRKIDAGMKGNADSISSLAETVGGEGTEIVDLKERMNIAEQDIDTAEEKIGTGELETVAKNLIDASNELLAMIQNEGVSIEALQQSIAGIGDAITGISQLAYTIANVYDSAQTYEVGAYAIYQNTLYKCITTISVGEAFDPAKWTSVKVMNEMHSGSGAVPASDVGYDNTESGLDATNAQAAIDEVQANVVEAKDEFTTYLGELKTTTLATGSTSATVTFDTTEIKATTIITPVCSKYGVAPTDVTYTSNTITFTFEAQTDDMVIGARVQNVI